MSDPQYSVAQFETMRLEISCLTRELNEAKKDSEQLQAKVSVPRMKLYAEIERLQLENHKLHGECGHLQADNKEAVAEIVELRAKAELASERIGMYRVFVASQPCECCEGHGGTPSHQCDRCRLLRSEP